VNPQPTLRQENTLKATNRTTRTNENPTAVFPRAEQHARPAETAPAQNAASSGDGSGTGPVDMGPEAGRKFAATFQEDRPACKPANLRRLVQGKRRRRMMAQELRM